MAIVEKDVVESQRQDRDCKWNVRLIGVIGSIIKYIIVIHSTIFLQYGINATLPFFKDIVDPTNVIVSPVN